MKYMVNPVRSVRFIVTKYQKIANWLCRIALGTTQIK